MEKTKRNKILAIAAGACTALVAFYGWQCSSYQDVFFAGTTINDISCGKMTVDEVEALLEEQVEGYELEIVFRDNEKEIISGKDIQYEYESSGGVQEIMDAQNHYLWFTSCFGDSSYEIETGITFNEKKVISAVKKLDHVQEENQIAPENAYIEFAEHEFVIQDEVEGATIQEDVLEDAVLNAVKNRETTLNLDEAGVYLEPEITKEDEQLHTQLDQLNELAKVSVTYTLPDGEKVLDGETIVSWLDVDEDGNYVKDDEKFDEEITAFVKELAEEVNTVGKA